MGLIKKTAKQILWIIILTGFMTVNALANDGDLQVVPHVDLARYQGNWYEIASFPQSFQKGCVATIANYSIRPDGDVDVVNTCRDKTFDGKIRTAKGKAWVTDPETNAKLRVRFFWPFSGKYWIIELGTDYDYAVIGHPDRDYLWILSRTPHMDQKLYDNLLAKISAKGFDLSKLKITPQP